MFRDLVRGNKLCYNFNEAKKYDIHIRKLHFAQRKVNTTVVLENLVPVAYEMQIPNQNKKNQQMEDKYTEIERENRILLEKITNIMHKCFLFSSLFNYIATRPRAQSYNPTQPTKGTLNSDKRKKELQQITHENQLILERIRNRRPNYETRRILKDTRRHDELLQRISEFPQQAPVAMKRSWHNKSTQSKQNPQKSGEFRPDQTNFQEPQLQSTDNKVILFKGTQQYNGQAYLVEIFFEDGLFKITADDPKQANTKILEMSQNDGQKVLMTMFKGNINEMAAQLIVKDRIHIQGLEKFEQIDEGEQEQDSEVNF